MTEDNVVQLRPADDEIAELNKTYAVVNIGNQVAILKQGKTADGRPDLSFIAVGHFETWMRNRSKLLTNSRGETKPMALAKYWLEHPQRRQFDGVVFRPLKDVPGYFNLWTGFAISPRPGCCDKFLAHIKDNICRGSDELFRWVMGFFADIFQNPGDKKDTSLVAARRVPARPRSARSSVACSATTTSASPTLDTSPGGSTSTCCPAYC
jgi:hypothetical protein